MTRVNGTFFERIILNHLCLYVPITILILVVSGGIKSIETILMMSFFMTIIMLIAIFADFIKIKRNLQLSKLILKDNKIYINELLIKSDEIISIRPIYISHHRWSLDIIEIKTETELYYLLDKPLMFWELLTDKKSRSISIIKDNNSELKNKILDKVEIVKEFPIKR